MTVNRTWVRQVEDVLAEIAPRRRPHASAEMHAAWAFKAYQDNAGGDYYAEQTPRARALRELDRIARWYGWQAEVLRALDAAGVTTPAGLDDDSLDQLLARLRSLEDALHNGGQAPDAPPAY